MKTAAAVLAALVLLGATGAAAGGPEPLIEGSFTNGFGAWTNKVGGQVRVQAVGLWAPGPVLGNTNVIFAVSNGTPPMVFYNEAVTNSALYVDGSGGVSVQATGTIRMTCGPLGTVYYGIQVTKP